MNTLEGKTKESGMITVEASLVFMAITSVLYIFICVIFGTINYLKAVDQAREIARTIAMGESTTTSVPFDQEIANDTVKITVETSIPLIPLKLSASSIARIENNDK